MCIYIILSFYYLLLEVSLKYEKKKLYISDILKDINVYVIIDYDISVIIVN